MSNISCKYAADKCPTQCERCAVEHRIAKLESELGKAREALGRANDDELAACRRAGDRWKKYEAERQNHDITKRELSEAGAENKQLREANRTYREALKTIRDWTGNDDLLWDDQGMCAAFALNDGMATLTKALTQGKED